MKSIILNSTIILLLIFVFNCKKDNQKIIEDLSVEAQTYSQYEESIDKQIDMSEQISDELIHNRENSPENQMNKDLLSCATINVDSSIPNVKIFTIDFGTIGCYDNQGKLHTGKIIVKKEKFLTYHKHTKTYINYGYDSVLFNGNSVSEIHLFNTLPYSSRSVNLTITHPNGIVNTRTSNHTITFIQGANTIFNPWDNVLSITGNASNVLSNGNFWSMNITSPIIRPASCLFRAVQGVKQVNKNGNLYSIDFGNGACDSVAIVTLPNGNTITINQFN